MSRDPTASLPSGIADASYKNDTLLMIEAEEPPQINPTGNLKDDAVFLLNDKKKSKSDQRIEKKWMGNMKKLSFNVWNDTVWLKSSW